MKLALITITALAGTAFAVPALAQAVIEDPGYCAQFYPNGNCQNLGSGNLSIKGSYYRGSQNENAMMSPMVPPNPMRTAIMADRNQTIEVI